MNKQFKLKNPVVEEILKNRSGFNSKNEELNESLTELIAFTLSPISSIIKSLLGMGELEDSAKFVKTDNALVEPESLQIEAPKVRYSSPPGLQLSRSSTIA